VTQEDLRGIRRQKRSIRNERDWRGTDEKDERGLRDRVFRAVHGHAQRAMRLIAGIFSNVGVHGRGRRQDDQGDDRDRRDNAPAKKTRGPMRSRSEIIDGSFHVCRGSLEATVDWRMMIVDSSHVSTSLP
jgi:hypothetical protein